VTKEIYKAIKISINGWSAKTFKAPLPLHIAECSLIMTPHLHMDMVSTKKI
jgi:hypothetical protein